MKTRLVAGVIDFAVLAGFQFILMLIFVLTPLVMNEIEAGQVIVRYIVITAVSMLYLFIRDNLGRKSIGKHLMKLSIIDSATGIEASFPIRLYRNITWLLGPLEVLILLIVKKRIGDMVAKTKIEDAIST